MPTPISETVVAQFGGAINDVPADTTASPHRDAEFLMNLHTRWENPTQNDECVAWVRECYDVLTPHAFGGTYVNFIPEDEGTDRVHVAYGETIHDRLVALKAEWDSDERSSI